MQRPVICEASFLGLGDLNALKSVARRVYGAEPLVLDMAGMAFGNPARAHAAMQKTEADLRVALDGETPVFISTGIDYMHPLANTLKNNLGGTWVDIRLDLGWQHRSFHGYPAAGKDRFVPVDTAFGLAGMQVGSMLSWLADVFSKFAQNRARIEIPFVPVEPDRQAMERQKARLLADMPELAGGCTAIMLGSYLTGASVREVKAVVRQARAMGKPVMVVTSPRTERQQKDVMDKLARTLTREGDAGVHIHRYDASKPEGNIYHGVLALADDAVVGSDSLTMIADAIVAGKRTYALTTLCERPRYLATLEQGGLLRRVGVAGLETGWQPAAVPDPFAVIAQTLTARQVPSSPQVMPNLAI